MQEPPKQNLAQSSPHSSNKQGRDYVHHRKPASFLPRQKEGGADEFNEGERGDRYRCRDETIVIIFDVDFLCVEPSRRGAVVPGGRVVRNYFTGKPPNLKDR